MNERGVGKKDRGEGVKPEGEGECEGECEVVRE